ncbi:MAG: BMP family ABC transporter substrate-binding protein [Clostridium butyricum]|nr:BMP family ABC transporter substrate-binding protein [Clostridium butyricum]
MKKIINWILICIVCFMSFTGCSVMSKSLDDNVFTDSSKTKKESNIRAVPKDNIKIGVIYLGSSQESSGYTYCHELGIKSMQFNIGLNDNQIIRKNNISSENELEVQAAIKECVDAECNIIFATSEGYTGAIIEAAKKYPNVYFSIVSGNLNNNENLNSYFGKMYQARYLSGIVAGMNTKSGKIGYVAAQGIDNSEVTSGIDAFAMGVDLVNKNAKVYVKVTGSWNDNSGEKLAADYLINNGCDILAQHCDSNNIQSIAQNAGIYSIGYNSDMSKEAPKASLVSCIWNWSGYYTYAVQNLIDGTWDKKNYYGGLPENTINISELASFNTFGVQEKVEEARKNILSGSCKIFDGQIETNDGHTVGEAGKTFDDDEILNKINWYYKNIVVC